MKRPRRTSIWMFVTLSCVLSVMFYISQYTNFSFSRNTLAIPDETVKSLFPKAVLQFYNWCKSRGVQLVVMDTALLEAVVHKTAVNWTDVVIVTYGAFQKQQHLLAQVIEFARLRQIGFMAHVVEVPLPETHPLENTENTGKLCYILRFKMTILTIQIMILREHKHFFTAGSYLWNAEKEGETSPQPLIMEKFSTKEILINGTIMQVPEATNQFRAELPLMRYISCSKTLGMNIVNDEKMQFLQALLHISSIAYKLGKPLFLFSGSLLGWYRECSFLDSTGDVDVTMFIQDYDKHLHKSLTSDDQINGQIFGKPSEGLQYQLKVMGERVDLFFAYNNSEKQGLWTQELQLSSMTKLRLYFPHFSICSGLLLDHIVHVPCPVIPVLEAEYGTGWRKPLKHWDWFKSPKNARRLGKWNSRDWPPIVRELDDKTVFDGW